MEMDHRPIQFQNKKLGAYLSHWVPLAYLVPLSALLCWAPAKGNISGTKQDGNTVQRAARGAERTGKRTTMGTQSDFDGNIHSKPPQRCIDI